MAVILVVEDDVQILRVLAMWFGRNGHDVLECRDGQAALETFDQQQVDVIISDVNMPRVGGLELVRALREDRKADVPIVVLSSRCDQSTIAADVGPYGIPVHPKPFSPSRLLTEVETLLAQRAGTASETGEPMARLSSGDRVEGI
jgi:DNA-binding response OmpR family regulator